jgi:hypothetical protein
MTPLEILLMVAGSSFLFAGASYSFFDENPIYNIAESIAIAGSIVVAIFGIYEGLMSSLFTPLIGGRITLFVPLILGILVFARLTKWRWVARYPIALLAGVGLGAVVGLEVRTSMLGAVRSTIIDAITGNPDPISGIIILVGVICAATYYLHSVAYARNFDIRTGRLGIISRLGRYFLMLAFGHVFTKMYLRQTVDTIAATLIMMMRRPVEKLAPSLGLYGAIAANFVPLIIILAILLIRYRDRLLAKTAV